MQILRVCFQIKERADTDKKSATTDFCDPISKTPKQNSYVARYIKFIINNYRHIHYCIRVSS